MMRRTPRDHAARGRRDERRCAEARHALRASVLAGVAALATVHTAALAQSIRYEAGLTLQETWTNNVNLEPTAVRRSDFVTAVTPMLTVREIGDHTHLDATVSVPIFLYARTGSENNNILPTARIFGDVNFLDRAARVEGEVNVTQQFFNPFGAQPPGGSSATNNRYQTVTYRVTPWIQDTTSSGVTYELRNNNVWVDVSDAPETTGDSRYTELIGRLSSPTERPFGGSASYHYTDTTFEQQGRSALRTQVARLVPFYNVDPQLRLEASVGYEKNQGTLTDYSGAVYGLGMEWRPTDRTRVVGTWEHRFFGSSYLASFEHRTRLSLWKVEVSRNVTTYPQQVANLSAGDDVSAYLNRLFLSAFPDAAGRQQAVDQFMRDRGLPGTLTGPVALYTNEIVLQQRQSATVGLFGARNSILFTAFHVRSEPISAAGDPLPPSLFSTNDNTQTGGSVVWTTQLEPAVSLSTTAVLLRTEANSPPAFTTNQGSIQVLLARSIGARTTIFAGGRYQALSSDVELPYNETGVFVGLRYLLR